MQISLVINRSNETLVLGESVRPLRDLVAGLNVIPFVSYLPTEATVTIRQWRLSSLFVFATLRKCRSSTRDKFQEDINLYNNITP